VLDSTVPAAPVQAALLEAGGDVIETCLLFDVFSGTPLPEGKKSLAFSLDLRAPDRTLTDEEADAVVRSIAARLASEFGAQLRAG
jgi:phenylalanyl-tRNA synthetase beta chain